MAILTILHDPDPRLRKVAKPVTVFDAALKTLVSDMFETMYDASGVGLAATQVGVMLRIAVMDCSKGDGPPEPIVLINPQIHDPQNLMEMEEGCLSIPDYRDKVARYHHVMVAAVDVDGSAFTLSADGLMAQAVQHEIDHLDGKLYVDKLSPLKRERYKKKRDKALKRP